MNGLTIIVLAGLVSYGLRSTLVFLAGSWQPPALVQRASTLVAPAALAAIAATSVRPQLMAGAAASLPLLGGLAIGALAVRRTGSANSALAVGLPTVWVLSALI